MTKTIVIDILCFPENIEKSSVCPFDGQDSKAQQMEILYRGGSQGLRFLQIVSFSYQKATSTITNLNPAFS